MSKVESSSCEWLNHLFSLLWKLLSQWWIMRDQVFNQKLKATHIAITWLQYYSMFLRLYCLGGEWNLFDHNSDNIVYYIYFSQITLSFYAFFILFYSFLLHWKMIFYPLCDSDILWVDKVSNVMLEKDKSPWNYVFILHVYLWEPHTSCISL